MWVQTYEGRRIPRTNVGLDDVCVSRRPLRASVTCQVSAILQAGDALLRSLQERVVAQEVDQIFKVFGAA